MMKELYARAQETFNEIWRSKVDQIIYRHSIKRKSKAPAQAKPKIEMTAKYWCRFSFIVNYARWS